MRALIVEDDPSMAASLRRGLEAEGYTVAVADNGLDGLFQAQQDDFDIVLLDIMLPKRNGYLVVTDLRASGSTVPVLMLTAKDGEWDQAEALDSGADDYLAKPFSYPVLLAKMRALIRRSAGIAEAILTVADLRIDPSAKRCWRAGIEIELTAREFAVLEYLAVQAGRVVSKTELVEHVWDQHREPDTNVVEVYVGYVRRKMDTPFDVQLLQTVRGAGYRLSAPVTAPE